ncbi:adenine phosphoribosyltransferase [Chloroflexota bacterium]
MYRQDSDQVISESEEEFKKYIRDIPDFPKKGIIFRDITNLLKNGEVFKKAVEQIVARFSREEIDVVCSVEARGFILGAAIAYALGAGFVPVRKKGKLPWNTHQESYDLEYGQDDLEIHTDAISAGNRVLLVDDVIATGGTAQATVDLVRKMEGKVVCTVFLIELLELNGRKKLKDVPVYSLIRY